MFRRLLSMNKKYIKNAELERFETGNWVEHIEKYKKLLESRKFFYNNVPTYNEADALNDLEGTMPGIDVDENNKLIKKN